MRGPDGSVGIVTGYGTGRPGSISGRDKRCFYFFQRPALGPTQRQMYLVRKLVKISKLSREWAI
jgi:hypothetical protein